ncbi:MAG: acyl-CoA dehydrogenase family protein [Ilumatobacteraceae bacterium]
MTKLEDDVRTWLDENWDESITVREWWRRLAESGYANPTWPTGLGGLGLDTRAAREVSEVLAEREVIGAPKGNGPNMGANTVLEHGTPEQHRQWVWPLATGEHAWCQLFSEPGAGSDLAGLQCKAIRDGDEFVVTGQKVWNSSANISELGMLLARTDPDVPKHSGLSWIMIDMEQPGILVRPLRQMNGDAEFCEVFLDEARAKVADTIGAINDGWKVARTTLAYERSAAASGTSRKIVQVNAGKLGGNLDRIVGDVVAEAKQRRTKRRGGDFVNSARTLIGLAQEAGVNTDPVLRDRLARYYIQSEVYRLTNLRSRTPALRAHTATFASIAKLGLGGLARTSRDLGMSIVGANGLVVGPDAPGPGGGRAQFAALSAQGVSIGGGTDEIQRNVLGERSLGLPREPSVDTDVPFKDLRVGTQRG